MEFTLKQALSAQEALRQASGLPAEQFPLDAFVGMLSDEIEALRNKGEKDEEIARLINDAAGTKLSSSDIATHYAAPEQRRRD